MMLRGSNNVGLCSSEEELNYLIQSLHYRIQHKSNTLSEEKQLLKEIKQLESTREKVIANAAVKAKIQDSLGPKEAIQDQVKLIGRSKKKRSKLLGRRCCRSGSAGRRRETASRDHLVMADLPVAKSLDAITSSATPALRSLGRRSRQVPGDRVHFCVRCDFPIAIYGRIIPCEHVFCLAYARSDSICYLCDERIQKIQTIKMMKGIFICAAPHCLKSFLKKSEFESHIHETHADILQPNVEKTMNDVDASNNMRLSLDSHKQSSQQPKSSTARAPSRPPFSPNSNFQLQDFDERTRRYPSRDQSSAKPQLQPKLSPFSGHLLSSSHLSTYRAKSVKWMIKLLTIACVSISFKLDEVIIPAFHDF